MKRLVLELDDKEHRAVKTAAAKEGKPMRAILRNLLQGWLLKRGRWEN